MLQGDIGEITVHVRFKNSSGGFGHDGADHNYPCPVYGDWGESGKMAAARKRMLRRLPERDFRDFYFWAWQVWSLRQQRQSAAWGQLERTVRPIVVATQIQLGTPKEQKGSWDPGADRYGDQWGRVGQTALGAIMLSLLDTP